MRHGISKNVVKRREKNERGECDSNPTFPKVSASGQEEDTVSAPISLYFHTTGVPAHTITVSGLHTSSEI
jgi:hypothetical protein